MGKKSLKRTAKPKGKAKPAPKSKAKSRVAKSRVAKPRVAKPRVAAKAPAPRIAPETEERLREAMEELVEARAELSRLGHEMTAAHRQIEDDRFASRSARENLRSELDAVRTDLKTALAELRSRAPIASASRPARSDGFMTWSRR